MLRKAIGDFVMRAMKGLSEALPGMLAPAETPLHCVELISDQGRIPTGFGSSPC
ncbi:hypothetical protein [Myxococcus vastator]|uniref:hypothetical protein n=1 Tax=Myxococcus vastator TaxID=2709664 RepID=UPI0013D3C77B|nr:hypothetical protein [Myxococcus vastator]